MLKRVVAIFDATQKVRKSPGRWPEMATSAIWKERRLGVMSAVFAISATSPVYL